MEKRILNTELLNEAYETLKEAKLVKSKADFSECWLRKSKRYYSMLATAQREISIEALATLAARLETTAQRMKGHGFRSAEHSTAMIDELAGKVAQALKERALTRGIGQRALKS